MHVLYEVWLQLTGSMATGGKANEGAGAKGTMAWQRISLSEGGGGGLVGGRGGEALALKTRAGELSEQECRVWPMRL